jgi:prepilin-type N-terminal cleavage/methylation domain-containing protein
MKRAFTLLEVMIAVAILAAAMLVLVNSQATAVLMTSETERVLTATMLAREKMAEIQVLMEREGFSQSDIEEEGHFGDFGADDPMKADLRLEVGDAYDEFRFAWTVRKVDLTMGGDITAMAETLGTSGLLGDASSSGSSSGKYSDLASEKESKQASASQYGDMMGSMVNQYMEMLGNFLREVRVVVWWGDNEDGTDQVELVSHIINPTGLVTSGDTSVDGGTTSGSTASPAKSSSTTSGGGSQGGLRGNKKK